MGCTDQDLGLYPVVDLILLLIQEQESHGLGCRICLTFEHLGLFFIG